MSAKKQVLRYMHLPGRQHGDISAPKYDGDAGFDLATDQDVLLPPGELTNVPIAIAVELPMGVVAFVVGRSSMAFQGLQCMGTLIDTGYRGPLFVAVYNITDKWVSIEAGTRIAQLVLLENLGPGCNVEQVKELGSSERGIRGFGSTGNAITIRTDLPVDTTAPAPPPKKSTPVERIWNVAHALAIVCNMPFEVNRGHLLKEAKNVSGLREFSIKELDRLYGHNGAWYAIDWRGKKGQRPTLMQIRETWLNVQDTAPQQQTPDGSPEDGWAYA